MKYLLPLLSVFMILNCGCTFVPRATVEVGAIDGGWNTFLMDDVAPGDMPSDMNGVEGAIRIEADVIEYGPFVVDVGIGPHVFGSYNRDGLVYGAEISSRIRIKATDWLEPYFIQVHGADRFEHAWEPQEVKYGFTTQLGLGARIIASERWSFNVDYRWWHSSWGEEFHGSDFRDLFGLEEKGPNFGFECGEIFVGASYEF